jgi:hypothetical protein
VLFFFLVQVAGSAVALAQADAPSFFPTPAPHANLLETSGIIENFGYGNKSGALDIRRADGSTHSFYLPSGIIRIAGSSFSCSHAPDPRHHSNPGVDNCPSWPKSIALGKTHVYVLYFWSTRYGQRAEVASEIRLHALKLSRHPLRA